MSRFLTEFNTYADYSGATLSLPNVSLIKNTGKVYYKNIYAGAVLGDILMWDVANQQLVATLNAQWDATTYPIADYEPIAINIYPASQTPDGKGRWMSLKWMSNSSASGSTTTLALKWGADGDNLTSKDKNAFNGRANTDAALLLADGTSANTQAAFAVFYATNIFHTNGTSAGDWYVPSYKELSLYLANNTSIDSQITLIKNASSSIVNTVSGVQWSSTEINNARAYKTNGSVWVSEYYSGRNTDGYGRGMLAL